MEWGDDDDDDDAKQPQAKVSKTMPPPELRCDLCGKSAEDAVTGALNFPARNVSKETSTLKSLPWKACGLTATCFGHCYKIEASFPEKGLSETKTSGSCVSGER